LCLSGKKSISVNLLVDEPRMKIIYASGYSADVAGSDLPLQEGVNFLAKP